MQFGEGEAELFALGENVFMPGEPSVQVESEVFDVPRLGELHIVEWTGGQVKVTWVDFVSLAFSRQS
jgi:hypothetical protein